MRIPAFIDHGIEYRLVGLSAIQAFLRRPLDSIVTVETTVGVVELAIAVDDLRFPGMEKWDAAFTNEDDREVLVACRDRLWRFGDPPPSLMGTSPLLHLAYDPLRRALSDPHGVYPLLRELRAASTPGRSIPTLRSSPQRKPPEKHPIEAPNLYGVEAAIVTAHLPLLSECSPQHVFDDGDTFDTTPEGIRIVLSRIMAGQAAWRGVDLLQRCGYIDQALPELTPMNATEHSKEGHPEGNVWRHTVETLRYRKRPDHIVGLALLLHDSGKPHSKQVGANRFHAHAEIGARLAHTLLHRLLFPKATTDAVTWLVSHHMIPGAIDRLPDYRRDPVMRSPLFPLLLEVYRCDVSSTYRGPEGYYRACHIYRTFLKKRFARPHNSDLKKLVKIYVR